MISQYREIKKKYPDAIVFYRMGDFYEMFFEDALTAAPILEVQLTSRDKSAENPIPMCGVPHHSATNYIQKLLARGIKVAICEQVEDPKAAKGLVRRDVIRVVTPALVGDPELVSEEATNVLVCLEEDDQKRIWVATVELLSGKFRLGFVDSFRQLLDLFAQIGPKEILITATTRATKWFSDLISLFPTMAITQRNFPQQATVEATAVAAIRTYLRETQKLDQLPHLEEPKALFESETLFIDSTSLSALEIARSSSVGCEGPTLFSILNFTFTPMGRRKLKEWLEHPSTSLHSITERLDAVEELVSHPLLSENLSKILSQIRDLERLTTKTALQLAMPRDLVAIREIMKFVPLLQQILSGTSHLQRWQRLDPLKDVTDLLEQALEDQPPATLRDGGIFRETFNPQIAELRGLAWNAKSAIAAIEAREKEATGIPSLKVRYSKVFGYTIEVTKSHLQRVPSYYVRKQTIAGGERFVTEELKALEEKIFTAEHKLKALEEGLFNDLRKRVADCTAVLLSNSKVIAELDVLAAFSRAAKRYGYIRPVFHSGYELKIEQGRHPVVETLLKAGQFVPNDTYFSEADCRTLIITGPNMAGKSTIMRQVALVVVMAHAGGFVPAKSAFIPLVDALYTRIGSSDDLTRGRSTFMVEMTEVARIIGCATARSLILIDEIGRGTSTYDGLSLAWSLLEFLHNDLRAKTLFATHFHEITALEKSLPGLKNANVLVEKWKDEIVFLHRLGSGICNQSYGIEVAKLAGLPSKVLLRAKEILGLLETQAQRANRARNRALDFHNNQMAFFGVEKAPE
ncbi:MAG: DNA mismatch repair protein MutS, partial [Deltaproteobacteria bacterium]|nr:DNA mismatch repair protein MutS [Deltaproteobacteria bacterium]